MSGIQPQTSPSEGLRKVATAVCSSLARNGSCLFAHICAVCLGHSEASFATLFSKKLTYLFYVITRWQADESMYCGGLTAPESPGIADTQASRPVGRRTRKLDSPQIPRCTETASFQSLKGAALRAVSCPPHLALPAKRTRNCLPPALISASLQADGGMLSFVGLTPGAAN